MKKELAVLTALTVMVGTATLEGCKAKAPVVASNQCSDNQTTECRYYQPQQQQHYYYGGGNNSGGSSGGSKEQSGGNNNSGSGGSSGGSATVTIGTGVTFSLSGRNLIVKRGNTSVCLKGGDSCLEILQVYGPGLLLLEIRPVAGVFTIPAKYTNGNFSSEDGVNWMDTGTNTAPNPNISFSSGILVVSDYPNGYMLQFNFPS